MHFANNYSFLVYLQGNIEDIKTLKKYKAIKLSRNKMGLFYRFPEDF